MTARRAFLIACTCLGIGLAGGWTAGEATARPATLTEAHIWNQVESYYQHLDIPMNPVPLTVATYAEMQAAGAGDAEAYTTPDGVVVNTGVAAGIRVFARTHSPRALVACDVPCVDVVKILLHEAGHVAQYTGGMTDDEYLQATWWYEGEAEAVAQDQLMPFLAHTFGRGVVAACNHPQPSVRGYPSPPACVPAEAYPGWTARVCKASLLATHGGWQAWAGRRWRITHLQGVRPV